MGSRRWFPIVLALAGTLPAQNDTAVVSAERARQLLESAGCQLELPASERAEPSEPSSPQPAQGGRALPAPRDEQPTWRLRADGGVAFAEVLLWTVLTIAAIALVVALWRGRLHGLAAPIPPAVRGTTTPSPAPDEAAPTLADHERLAAAGDYAGAIRALLAAAFAALAARAVVLPRHATPRAGVRRARAAGLSADELAQLVGCAERVHFAGDPADQGRYEAALAHFRAFRERCTTPR